MKILVAEDEPSILQTYQIILESRGHQVELTTNGEECTKVYTNALTQLASTSKESLAAHPPFDAVVLDYRMPKMDGMDAAKVILAKNPAQRIIFASAYVMSTLEESVKQLHAVVELLQKPFEIDVLVDTIEDKRIYEELKKVNVNIKAIQGLNPSHQEIQDLLQALRKLHKATPLLGT